MYLEFYIKSYAIRPHCVAHTVCVVARTFAYSIRALKQLPASGFNICRLQIL